MKNICAKLILIASVSLAAISCQHAPMPPVINSMPRTSTEELCRTLDAQPPVDLLPELAARTPAQWAETKTGTALLNAAKRAADVTAIPETTYTRYRMFKTAGERAPYDREHGTKRSLLRSEVLAAWLGGDNSRIDRINDLIWSICEETTWVGPAHEKSNRYIDLYAAETAADLAYVLTLLGDRLPDEIRERVRNEIDRRIFEPYLEHGHEAWWDSGRNNWTGVCAGSVGQAFLLLETDTARQAQALEIVVDQLDRFIEIAFEPDGGCLEGIGYWNYGLLHYVCLAEMLRLRTGGEIDLLANPKLKAIAAYPLAVVIAKNTYASFSDAHERSSVKPFLAARLAERTGVDGLLALTADGPGGRLAEALRDLCWWNGTRAEMTKLENSFLPVSGVARLVDTAGPHNVVLAAKAGHNAESHNHNDVGSFILAVDGIVYLCDPGSGLYDAAYFSTKRYDNVFANSYGHSVPRIGGKLQLTGKERHGVMEKTGEKSVALTFEKAYGIPSLTQASRSFELNNGEVVLQDAFVFQDEPLEVEEAFMTWHEVETSGNTARITTPNGALEIRTEKGSFTSEKLDEACKANKKKDTLTRISITYPPAKKTQTRFSIRFQPK
ncbi:MAG TPA: heparinase II/III family protein [Candidatus Bathyarchaeia archaeon]|nr:heparinase II/III family protein [Candidatus Bathyarchaeia archaeon]